ncbi:DNA cytosine methyltransferase [Sphingobacterium mizutaii]|uniref:DNA cytosine methyltransferase n=1 Tax=Sphingobacterium mizutaii TaxID=1010 RepID=UPI001626ADF8|nr:DNA (cytosine-5-)-methyltransferase [Sphingobacterium mizutaii]
MLRHGSLFSGIGGFDIAASWMGWQNVFSCEKDPFCRTVLKHYWPNTTHYEDIYDFQAAHFRGHIDIISGGFPCQPFSQAGRRKGPEDDRYLFPETVRIIKEARPEWIVLENVTGLFTILEPDSLSEMEIKAVELFCEDGEQPATSTIIRLQRRVIGSIISEIGAAGYVLPTLEDGTPVILCIPAAAVGAPHQRDRVWFVAHTDRHRDQQPKNDHPTGQGRAAAKGQEERQGQRRTGIPDGFSGLPYLAGHSDTARGNGDGDAEPHPTAPAPGIAHSGADRWHQIPVWSGWPIESPFCGRDDGLPERLDGVTFPTWRAESIKAYGNAIVPQVALEIFRAIQSVTLSHKVS